MSKLESRIPKLRFKGFTDKWGDNTLGKLINYIKGFAFSTNLYQENGIQIIRVSDLGTSSIISKNTKIFIDRSLVDEHQNYLIKKNDILITTVGSKSELQDSAVGRAIFIKNDIDGLLNQNLVKISTNIANPHFLYNIFLQKKYRNHVAMIERGNANQANITITDLWAYKFCRPNLEEQTQIGNFFQQLDQLIELQQKSLSTVQDYKKSMLQKMFPQKGEKTPKVRFKGFSEDWKETKLSKVAEIYRGLTYKPKNIVKSENGVRVLRSSNIKEDILALYSDDVFINADAVKLENIKIGDILITAANGSSRLVGKHAVITEKLHNTVHGGFMLTARTEVPFFINSWMNTYEYKIMLQLVQGGNGAIGNLSKPALEACKIHVPKIEEQKKIGAFFQKLDQQIEQHENKLKNYQQLKKAMLQRLFV